MDRPTDASRPSAEPDPDTQSGSRPSPTDAERYQWIRANRGNTVITEALRASHFDDDFDRQIDDAMHAQRDGHAVGRLARHEHPFGRRKSDYD